MPADVRQEGVQNLAYAQTTHRGLLERALQMRAVSYLAQQKAILLTQTIFEIDRSKDELRTHSLSLEKDREIIQRQKAELEARTAVLEEIQRTLEQRVSKRTQELERANAALREEAAARERIQCEREELHGKYLRAQKLELVGLLTGGVAHDFNNLLTVIMGHGELALAALAGTSVAENLEAIIDASRRGGELTRQLLAFARKRVRNPTVIEPARIVEEFAQLLRRVLGESVTLELQIEPNLGNVRLGASELEQVVLNLIVNARDAMPHGGTVVLSLKRVVRLENEPAPHGPCIVLCVNDTGEGMSEEVVQHVFEPFFTTKPTGVGTGLGLATVHAIARDYGGEIEVETRVGAGTTFRVYFPIVTEPSELRSTAKDLGALPHGSEALLVVDDDESIQRVVRHMLQALGYRVFTADSVASALALLGHERVDLMLLDSLMPGASSEALVSEVALRWPATRVLFMFCSADRARPLDGSGRPYPYIEKPLELAALARAVREVVDPAAD